MKRPANLVEHRTRRSTISCGAACLLGLSLLTPQPGLADDDPEHERLRNKILTVQGEVISVERAPAEAGLEVVAIRVREEDGKQTERLWLLAPAFALEEIPFHVAAHERVRARVFPEGEGPLPVHKIWNLDRREEVRLRTLHREPVWNEEGEWQGSRREDCPHRPWKEPAAEDTAGKPAPKT